MGAEKKLVVMSRAEEMTRFAEVAHRDGHTIALVPTMGNLHEGHVSLVQAARDHADIVVVSIFVNPTQFAAGEDFEKYPRTLEADLETLDGKADVVFTPSVDEIYPPGSDLPIVRAGAIGEVLEGASRPGHFDGVLTVCRRLFDLTAADVAVFGQKDAQQLFLVTEMVRLQGLPITIVSAPTVRARDGVALSSRNSYLSPDQRETASAIPRALSAVEGALEEGLPLDQALARGRSLLHSTPGLSLDYLEVVSADTFLPPEEGDAAPLLVLVAARVGTTRLIDNICLR